MSMQVEQFCDSLRNRLNTVETRLKRAKTNVEALTGQADKAVREQFDEMHRKVQAQKERLERTRADLDCRAEQKMTETRDMVNEWKAKHELIRLQARAERAYAYAEDAIALAALMIDEAEAAILEAVVARMDAEAVISPAEAAR